MPTALPARFRGVLRAGLPPADLARAAIAAACLRRVEGRLARARAERDLAVLGALMERRIRLHEKAASLLGAPVPAAVYAEREALRAWIARDLHCLERELRRLAWADARKGRAAAAGDRRAAAAAHRLGQAACDRIAALTRRPA
ncbi:hypothetical protein OPKNFCMD_4952 [Methylobacterium crusticola]|uniref:Uncharacterized protein n=1 Tax=Methylobacterium crusticola TaxID=1697972 RepID=A0ABQ4R4X9_9HYPH|nr:hypothetical protein [Methylobacterium crusticola]GJD52190.1 hypothetical protein OPKNFCMD_4952 [Methylobacterium crusticola]